MHSVDALPPALLAQLNQHGHTKRCWVWKYFANLTIRAGMVPKMTVLKPR